MNLSRLSEVSGASSFGVNVSLEILSSDFTVSMLSEGRKIRSFLYRQDRYFEILPKSTSANDLTFERQPSFSYFSIPSDRYILIFHSFRFLVHPSLQHGPQRQILTRPRLSLVVYPWSFLCSPHCNRALCLRCNSTMPKPALD